MNLSYQNTSVTGERLVEGRSNHRRCPYDTLVSGKIRGCMVRWCPLEKYGVEPSKWSKLSWDDEPLYVVLHTRCFGRLPPPSHTPVILSCIVVLLFLLLPGAFVTSLVSTLTLSNASLVHFTLAVLTPFASLPSSVLRTLTRVPAFRY
jgi:hypothetical protein